MKLAIGTCLLVAIGCSPTAPHGAGSGEELFTYCSPCHREDGSGNEAFGAPPIAGLSDWYLQRQLTKFRNGKRGKHPDDVEGLRMRPMSRALEREEDVKAVVAYVSTLSRANPSPTLQGGDKTKGKSLYIVCVTCHGPDGNGSFEQKAPSLRHLPDWYMFRQLKKLKSGVRGDPQDQFTASMNAMASTLVDEQAMLDVVAYITTLRN